MNSYQELAIALADIGLSAQMMRPYQLVVSVQEGSVWPDRGNSFWMSERDGVWYLSTWAPVCYRVSRTEDLVRLCSACMEVGDSAMYCVPEKIIGRFGLEEVSDPEFRRIFEDDDDETES